jgi:hypothetical protein
MSINKDDFLVVSHKKTDDKTVLLLVKAKANASDSKTVKAELQEMPHIRSKIDHYEVKNVVLNLGPRPEPGKVYGFDLSRVYLGSREHEYFGDFHFFTRLNKEAGSKLFKGADYVAKKLRKQGLDFLFDCNCVYEIVPKHGKYAGMYYPERKKQDIPPRIQLSVDKSFVESSPITDAYSYVLMHEIGHLVHLKFLRNKTALNAKWINKYSTTIKPRVVTKEQSHALLDELPSHQEDGLRGLVASLEDDEAKADLKLVIKWIRETKSIDLRDLDTLIRNGDNSKEVLRGLWPTIPVQSKKLSPLVTEYACKNVRELFAESFAFYMLGSKLPNSISSLMERSLQEAINNKGLLDEDDEDPDPERDSD